MLEILKRYLGRSRDEIAAYYITVRQSLNVKPTINQLLKDVFFISFGIFSAGFGLKSFLLPNGFIDGGVTGISLLIQVLTGYPLSILIVLINTPFIILGYLQIGRKFVFKSIVAILGLAVVLSTVQYPIITSDKLLVAVFGGFFLGAGIGLTVRGGGVLDGTEVLAIYLTRKTKLTIGDLILIFNILVFSIAAYLLSIEIAMYSILIYFTASKTVDFIIEGVEEYIGVTIVSVYSEEIRIMITEYLGKGATVYYGRRGFGSSREDLNKTDIIYSVITRLEVSKFRSEVYKIDSNAFMVMSSVRDLQGGMIKKSRFKEQVPRRHGKKTVEKK